MTSMNENAGVIRLDTLGQSGYWVDRHGNQHALTDMTQSYLASVLSFLRARAGRLYQLEINRQEFALIAAVTDGWDNGVDAIAPRQGPEAAADWLENTPLVTTLRTMLGETGR